MKFNLSSIMAEAWKIFRKGVASFSIALKMAWANAKQHNAVKAATRISEETHSWAGWKALGYEVQHGSTALYKVVIADPATKTGQRTKAFFGLSQVHPAA